MTDAPEEGGGGKPNPSSNELNIGSVLSQDEWFTLENFNQYYSKKPISSEAASLAYDASAMGINGKVLSVVVNGNKNMISAYPKDFIVESGQSFLQGFPQLQTFFDGLEDGKYYLTTDSSTAEGLIGGTLDVFTQQEIDGMLNQ